MNRYILELCSERPIAFIPILARVAGSASAGLFLSQILYWSGKGWKGEWVYKTVEEVRQETCLSRSEQQTAIEKWKELGVLEKEVRGVPPIRHFRVDIPALEKLLFSDYQQVPFSNSNGRKAQNTITESTTEKTNKYPAGKKPAAHVDRF